MTKLMKMTWQRGRQLATLQKGSTAVSYQYNESGLRTKKTVNGVSTIYDRDASRNIVHQKGGNNELWYYYDAQGNIGSISHNGTRYALRKNAQGDVIALMDTNGDVAAQYAYDAWGNVLDVTDYRGRTITDPNHVALANPIRYRGYFYDTETGFYYLQSRYYDPMTCRFLNADNKLAGNSSIQGCNLFAYCNNNPVNMSDEAGNWPKWLSGALDMINGGCQIISGFALVSTAGWTGVGAVAGGALMANGFCTALAGGGKVANDLSNSNTFSEENAIKTGCRMIGNAIGGDTGEQIGKGIYDGANFAADIYSIGGGVNTIAKTAKAYKTTKQVISIKRTSVTINGISGKLFTKNYLVKYRLTNSFVTTQQYITVPRTWLRVVDGISFGIDRTNNVFNIF